MTHSNLYDLSSRFCNVHISNFLFIALQAIFFISSIGIANADYAKALTAYQNRDGQSLLREVEASVVSGNDDGLILLLTAIRLDSFESSRLFFYYNDDNAKPSTLKSILNESEREVLYNLLLEATNNSNAQARKNLRPNAFFFDKELVQKLNKTQNEIAISKGDQFDKINASRMPLYQSYMIRRDDPKSPIDRHAYENAMIKAAELGNPPSQLALAYAYGSHMFGNVGPLCAFSFDGSICKSKDEEKSDYWLNESIKGFERYSKLSFKYPQKTSICDFYDSTSDEYKQKYARDKILWCLLEKSYPSELNPNYLALLAERDKNFKSAVPEINAIKDDIVKVRTLLRSGYILPNKMMKARLELRQEGMPLFRYYVKENLEYVLEVYPDGRVMFGYDDWIVPLWMPESKALLMTVSVQTIEHFLSELKKINFDNMPMFGKSDSACARGDSSCDLQRKFEFTLVTEKSFKRIYRTSSDQNVDFLKQDSEFNLEIAPIVALTEKYFPTKKLRCEIGNSENYKKACLERDSQWQSMANLKPQN